MSYKIKSIVSNSSVICTKEIFFSILGDLFKETNYFEVLISDSLLEQYLKSIKARILLEISKRVEVEPDGFIPVVTCIFEQRSLVINMQKEFELAVLLSLSSLFEQTITKKGKLFIYDLSEFGDAKFLILKILANRESNINDILASIRDKKIISNKYDNLLEDLSSLLDNGLIFLNEGSYSITHRGLLLCL
ncbi:hypothetical protein CAP35_10595 [Chitinophagaceae bacterium IBVUCB1]|nr:hypothetical protein CAP35_10595 [Chitinophagaceae bacterium IBVUCB1]